MNINPGTKLGSYEIISKIGAGGMGEVWRARDSRLGRDVAVKVLPESFSASDDRVRRFEQEARAAGTLNHPGLVTIFDVGTHDSAPYIVMELLEGETVRDVLGEEKPSPLPVRKAIDYATQIALALAVAHENRIIHRDLKPENLFVTKDGRVKILDFGLAKLVGESPAADDDQTQQKQTSPGTVMGTAGYMSPEQVRAQDIDHRSDIFSLGAILFEMLTGQRAFKRDSSVETMNAILKEDPPELATFDQKLPPALDQIVRHCLEKSPHERFQSARDLAFQLRTLHDMSGSSIGKVTALPSRKKLPYAMAAAILIAALAGAGAFALVRGRFNASPIAGRSFQQLTFGAGVEMFPTLSPDGKTFAYVSSESGNDDIYVQRIDGRTPINLTRSSIANDTSPSFSRDGSQIAFRSERDGGGIFVMGATGESVRRLTDFGYNPSWSPDGSRLVVATVHVKLAPHSRSGMSELWLIDARSGAKRPLIQHTAAAAQKSREGRDAVQPAWSPNGHRIAFWGRGGKFSSRDLWTIEPDAKEPLKTLVQVTDDPALDWNVLWSSDGKFLLFGSDRDGTLNLWRLRVDEQSGKPAGEPESLALPAEFSGHFATTQQGEIAFLTKTRADRVLRLPLDVKTGTPEASVGGSFEIGQFEPSPDGRSVAFTTGGGQEDLFVASADGSDVRQLTNDEERDRYAGWSPDGRRLYSYSNRAGAWDVWSINVDGSGLTQVTDVAASKLEAGALFYPEVSPDGKTLVVCAERFGALVHLSRPMAQRIELIGSVDENHTIDFPRWSPDGKRIIAGLSNIRSGDAPGIALYSLDNRRWEKILDRGYLPRWLPGGKRIAFFEKNRSMGVLDLETRAVTMTAIPGLPEDVESAGSTPDIKLSADGTTLYVKQRQQQGDIWLMRPGKQ
ncbi:MAG TPA: protein kinase [Thermoanaerobaculia bacterium]|nr:protein kinase [Thermoanaerobaculia bacterium]